MSVFADTFGQLPAITRPMPAIPFAEGARHKGTLSDDGERWTMWGAAHAGARILVTTHQQIGLGISAAAMLCLAIAMPHALLLLAVAVATCMYLVAAVYKGILLLRGEHAAGIVAADPQSIPDTQLPVYSVLVPLYHEAKFAPVIIDRLLMLDYPADRLDVLLLVESDDDETRTALESCALPPHMRTVTVPPGLPRTKPRALNVGLAHALGEYIVVYDAEDRPEPDQIRKAAVAFGTLPRRVVCLQARLNFYNRHQTLLTRLFSVDYATWYDMLLPGLVGQRALVPLGGTSNHFRVDALRRLGGWDPFNVTEDADLGVRIARAHLDVQMLDSTTWEEAVAHVPQWIRQRSRWVKGYMQTYLVHMRTPRQLLREVGPRAFVDFQMLVGGTCFILLVNPIMWTLTILYFLTKGSPVGIAIQSLFPPVLYYPALFCLLANFAFFYSQLYICVRRGYDDLARYSLLGPLYWLLMSFGAWAGFISLLRDPYYWAKTEHGVSLNAFAPAIPNAPDHTMSIMSSVATAEPPERVVSCQSAEVRIASPASVRTREISVILPAHNEEAIIAETVRSVSETLSAWEMDFEIIVVNDGSTDRTRAILESLAEVNDWLCVISHEVNRGYGAALVTGFEAARKDLVFFMDADGQFDIRDLQRLLPLAGQYHAVLGYRVARQDSWMRKLNAFGWKLLVWLVLGIHVRDIDCAFKLLPREFFLQHRLQSSGAMINAELLYRLHQDGYGIAEVGVQHFDRRGGRATGAKLSVIFRAFKELIVSAWKWRITPGLQMRHSWR